MEKFKTILTAKRVKLTYQRLMVLKYLRENKTHPTIDTIYKTLIEEIPTMSKTTVYNTLNIFCKKGLLVPVTIPGMEKRYDGNVSWHHHFLCEECNRLIDIDIKCEYFERGEVNGHRIKEVYGYFKGVCRDCCEKAKRKKEEVTMDKYECTICGYIYDPENGDPDSGVEPGTPFEQLPDDWVCPECGADKDAFEKVD